MHKHSHSHLRDAHVKDAARDVPILVGLVHRRPLADELLDARHVPPEGGPVQGYLSPRVGALDARPPEHELAEDTQLAVSGCPVQRGAITARHTQGGKQGVMLLRN